MRYIVFAYSRFYPCGGVKDIVFSTNDLVEARHKSHDLCHSEGQDYDFSEVLDTESMVLVYKGHTNEEVSVPALSYR